VVRAFGLTDSAIGLTLLVLATTAELFALAWAAMRRGVSEIAVAGVIGSVAYNATATLGVAALVRPLAVTGILGPAIAAAILPVALLLVTPWPAGVPTSVATLRRTLSLASACLIARASPACVMATVRVARVATRSFSADRTLAAES
jgi:Ca2+/Na+ antiporter